MYDLASLAEPLVFSLVSNFVKFVVKFTFVFKSAVDPGINFETAF